MKPEHIAWFRRAFLRHGPRRYAVMQPERADRKYDDHPGEMTDRQIRDHLDGRAAYAVPTAENGLAHFLPLDIDSGGEDAARALLDAAQARSLWAFGQVDTGRGRGYVWIPFDDLANAERIKRLGDQLIDQVQRPGWRIENRASNEDTRLPFARHRWTGIYGTLILPGPQWGKTGENYEETAGNLRVSMWDHIDIDTDPAEAFALLAGDYRENPTDQLPPPPAAPERTPTNTAPQGQGITIAAYNSQTDLTGLLESYGARRARGQGARLYFCPFHSDDHASLLVTRDGARCKCLSQGSECLLSTHQNDAFNIFCVGEQLTPQQALRRLNGLPDDPEPSSGPPIPPRGNTPPNIPRTPPQTRGETRETKKATVTAPKHPSASLRASQARLDLPARPTEGRTTASDGRRLPKTCRRLLDIIAEHPGGYIRGKYHLARLLDCDPRTVQRSLRRLEAEGLITRQERGREGQTDIYLLTAFGKFQHSAVIETAASLSSEANQVTIRNQPKTVIQSDPEGRHLPPTLELVSNTNPEALEAERGGQRHGPGVTPASANIGSRTHTQFHSVDPQAIKVAVPEPNIALAPDQDKARIAFVSDEEITGPGGAFVIAGGAAYVPPEAEDWYAGLVQLARRAAPPDPEPAQVPLDVPEPVASYDANAPADPPPPRKKRRRSTGRARYVDPGHLHGRIIAATRKAEKLERGNAAQQRQARAIRRSAEQLQRQLDAMRASAAEGDPDEPEAEDWTPPPTPATAPPSSFLPGVDWSYLERLASAGEIGGIETHCRLYQSDVREVCAELARRGVLMAGRAG